jgi:hypothetical protein
VGGESAEAIEKDNGLLREDEDKRMYECNWGREWVYLSSAMDTSYKGSHEMLRRYFQVDGGSG